MLRGSKNHKFMYDLIVIGAGSGGVRAARISGGYGAKVALVESSLHHGPPTYTAIGGTCVNVGCVPKKLFVYGSHYASHLKDSVGFGWTIEGQNGLNKDSLHDAALSHKWNTLVENKNKEVDRLNGIYGRMLAGAGVELIEATGKLLDKNTVEVTTATGDKKSITAETILIAVGGWPYKPDTPGIEHAVTSNEMFYLKERPKKVVIVGAGYIGVEFANIMKGYGCEVVLLHRGDMFLRGFDDDVRRHLAQQMQASGIDLQFCTDVTNIVKRGENDFVVECSTAGKIECNLVLYATGRRAKTQELGLDKAGVVVDKDGHIPVNEWSRTSVPNIYAIGDVTDRINLTPVALHEGHCFADSMYGPKEKERKPDHEYVCSAVFSEPEVGSVGYTEETALEKFKGNISIFTTSYMPLKDRISNRTYRKDFMKLVVDDTTDRVIGLHMCCGSAAEMLQGFGVAIKMGAKKSDFDSTIGIHPTGAEELVTMRESKHWYDEKGIKHEGQRPETKPVSQKL